MNPTGSAAPAALLFLFRRTLRNRFGGLAKKLRTPRYAIAFVAGLVYFGLVFGPLVWTDRADVDPTLVAVSPWAISLAALALTGWAVWWWTMGKYHEKLAFSPAETDFLLGGPADRRTLVTYKLAQAQLGIVAFATMTTVLAATSELTWPFRLVSLWILFTTIHFHQVAAALVRTAATEQGVGGIRRQWLPLTLFATVLGVVGFHVLDALPAVTTAVASGDVEAGMRRVATALDRPGPRVALFPVRLVLAPLFAEDAAAWAAALPGAAAVIGLHFAWVLRTDAAFEEGAAQAGRERAKRVEALQAGGLLRAALARSGKVGRPAFALRAEGRPWVGIVWKNLTMMVRSVRVTILLYLSLPAAIILVSEWDGGVRGLASFTALMLVGGALLLSLVGVFFFRNDLRADLQKAELLRTYPLTGVELVGAEIGSSALSLTLVQWTLLACAAVLALPLTPVPRAEWVVAGGILYALFLPPINAVIVAIQNALAIHFPAWTPLGRTRTGGIEQMGIMLLTSLATALFAVMAALPPLLAGGSLFFVSRPFLHAWAAGPAGAAAWVILWAEVGLLVVFSGRQWDEMDVVEAGLLE